MLTPAGHAAHAAAARLFAPVLDQVEAALGLPAGEARATLAAINSAVLTAIAIGST